MTRRYDPETRGYWQATDDALNWINSLDTVGMAPGAVRSAIYSHLMEMAPPSPLRFVDPHPIAISNLIPDWAWSEWVQEQGIAE